MNKHDQKVFNTKIKIYDAFLQLLEEKEFIKISILDICAVAGISRTTFYAHYDNTDMLLRELYNDILKDFKNEFTKQDFIDIQKEIDHGEANILVNKDILMIYLSYLKRHQRLVQIFIKNKNVFFNDENTEELKQYIFIPLYEKMGFLDKAAISYYYVFYLSGISAITDRWILNYCVESVDYISDLIIECVTHNVFSKLS